jgi:uncharacterized protein
MESGQSRKSAVVTGASSGIGFELAKVFAEGGFHLLIAAEDAELTGAQESLKATGAEVQAHRDSVKAEKHREMAEPAKED